MKIHLKKKTVIPVEINNRECILTIDADTSNGGKIANVEFNGNLLCKGGHFPNPNVIGDIRRPVHFTIDNCSFTLFKSDGCKWGVIDGVITNSMFSNNEENGLILLQVGNKVSNCTSYFNKKSGFYINVGTNLLSNCKSFYNGRLYNPSNYTEESEQDCWAGYTVYNARLVQLNNCSTQQNYKHGFYIYGNSNIISGANCIADNLSADENGAAFFIRGNYNKIDATVEVDAPKDWGSSYGCSIYYMNAKTINDINITRLINEYLPNYSDIKSNVNINTTYGNVIINGNSVYTKSDIISRQYSKSISLFGNNTYNIGDTFYFTVDEVNKTLGQSFLTINKNCSEVTAFKIESDTNTDEFTINIGIYGINDDSSLKTISSKQYTLRNNSIYTVTNWQLNDNTYKDYVLVYSFRANTYTKTNNAVKLITYPIYTIGFGNNFENYYKRLVGTIDNRPIILDNEQLRLFYNYTQTALNVGVNGKWHKIPTYDDNILFVGVTENRPTDVQAGFQYFDTTLNKPIYWTGTEWVDSEGNNADSTPITSGTFANKPTGTINVGYAYFCTDKQTTEGSTNGIMIYYKGDNVWVDALGRVVS